MNVKSIAQLFLASLIFFLPISNASAEKINIDEAYYEKNLIGQCLFGFSKQRNEKIKISFESKTSGRYLTESFIDSKQEISLSDGNIVLKNPRGKFAIRIDIKNGKSFARDIKKSERDEQEVFLGDCKTSYSKMNNLPAFPSASVAASNGGAPAAPSTVKVDKNEIAALEKKLAALKQKAARKEEYQKMRSLLDQKLKEVQAQIQMLEQEYKDVLN